MKATITYLKTGKVETLEITEVFYSQDKIVLFTKSGFHSFFHGDPVTIEIK